MTTIDPRWLTSAVVDLIAEYDAAVIAGEPATWERLPILRDALMDAGCDKDLDGLLAINEHRLVPFGGFKSDDSRFGFLHKAVWTDTMSEYRDCIIPTWMKANTTSRMHICNSTPFAACLDFCHSYAQAGVQYRQMWTR